MKRKNYYNVGWTMVHLKTKYLLLFTWLFAATACTHQAPQVSPLPESNYPADVAKIIINKCATAGCHNNNSYSGAGGLNLTTWDKLFEGGSTGAVVIPFRPDFSTLCFYTNTDTTLGVTLIPTMPVTNTPLSREEYLTLSNWINNGAANANGNVKFAGNPNRSKIYVTNKLCDVVTVFDAATLLQMRYIDVGTTNLQEFPHAVKVSPDKKHWYVSFFSTKDVVQKFNAVDDSPVGNINIGNGAWTSFDITSDSKLGYFVDNSSPGKLAVVDLETQTLLATHTFNNLLQYPTGIVINDALKKLYIGNNNGNYIYVVDIHNPLQPTIKTLPIDGTIQLQYHSGINPTELIINDATNHCYIACTQSNEIRVMDMLTDSVVAVIPIGSPPAYMSLSQRSNKLFISCPDDEHTFPGNRGAVVVVDLITNSVVRKIKTGYQPYGIAADDERGIVAVVNANLSPKGNAPHHTSNCGGRNGNVSFIDMKTLELIPGKRSEVAVYPFGISIR